MSHVRCKRFLENGEGGPDNVIPAISWRESIRISMES